MTTALRKSAFTIGLLGLLVLALAAPAHAGSVNKSVRIEAGQQVDEASSVNGSVTVGEGAVVSGEVSTVNGQIQIYENAEVQEVSTVNGELRVAGGASSRNLSTVNGSIRVDEDVTVDGWIEAVNGRISVDKGSTVASHVSNVNGEIELDGSDVGGDLSTVNGDVTLDNGAVLRGDLIVEKPGGWNWGFKKRRVPEVVIGPNSRVMGTIRLERQVKLYISDTAEVDAVEGELSMSDAVRFSGARP